MEGKPYLLGEAAELKRRQETLQRLWAEHGNKPLIQEMSRIVEETLTDYHSDFYLWDLGQLIDNPDISFVWVVRDMGTYLIPLEAPVKECSEARKLYAACCRTWRDIKAYVVQGATGALKPIAPDKVRFTAREAA
ncbi:MAG: hypothetical protein ACYC9Q_09160 [Bacillota bacterium]